jgi:hypothetical protein
VRRARKGAKGIRETGSNLVAYSSQFEVEGHPQVHSRRDPGQGSNVTTLPELVAGLLVNELVALRSE